MDLASIISEERQIADNFDKYRSPWESVTHWRVRKLFLIKNWENFKDKERLICLSQAWVNVHFHGNRYPQGVMDSLEDLQEGLDPPDQMLRDAELEIIRKR